MFTLPTGLVSASAGCRFTRARIQVTLLHGLLHTEKITVNINEIISTN